jgi:prepilin-type N-terminal cleavage/methylation domain-containing protein
MTRGATLPELLSVTLIIGVLSSIALPPLRRFLDRAAVASAADHVAALHDAARQGAIIRGLLTRYEIDPVRVTVTLATRRRSGAWDTVLVVPLGPVRASASQRVVTFSPLGIGFGASNTRLVFARGFSSETLTVSRTGRLRRW